MFSFLTLFYLFVSKVCSPLSMVKANDGGRTGPPLFLGEKGEATPMEEQYLVPALLRQSVHQRLRKQSVIDSPIYLRGSCNRSSLMYRSFSRLRIINMRVVTLSKNYRAFSANSFLLNRLSVYFRRSPRNIFLTSAIIDTDVRKSSLCSY